MRPRETRAAREGRSGYTLIELMIVISLVVIMALLATPVFKDMVGRYRLNAAAAATASLVTQARSMATARGTPTRVVFTKIGGGASDGDPANGGAFRIEQYVCQPAAGPNTAPPFCNWQLADDPVVGRVISNVDKDCLNTSNHTEYNEFCVNVGYRYPWVSLALVEAVGSRLTASPGDPAIEFSADGLVVNDRGDFALGNDSQHIKAVLISKRKNGKLESRIISIDRAGNVDVTPSVGTSLPTL